MWGFSMILDTLQTVVAFIVTLGILVSFHEFGHFWVARRCGIKVLRFSVGFGKSLWKRTDRQGTEYAISVIPLGGYVKMLDEREGDVSESEKHLSFNNKPVLTRIAVVIAGPIANFLLAIAVLWLMYIIGVQDVVPQVGDVIPGSPAAEASIEKGDEIVSIDGKLTSGWQLVNMALISFIGESKRVIVEVRQKSIGNIKSDIIYEKHLVIKDWLVNEEQPNPLKSLGIIPFSPEVPAIIGEVLERGAAFKAGILVGDKVLSVDGISVSNWFQWVQVVRDHPNENMDVELLRRDKLIYIQLTPDVKVVEEQRLGYIGAGVQAFSWPENMIRKLKFGPVDALLKGVEETWTLTSMTFQTLWKMVIGLVSVKNLSGPIAIAKIAGASLQSGVQSFLYFLAMLSVSLGVLNLLPIPVLDGGHLLFYLAEVVRGRPLSEKVQNMGVKIGVGLVMCVMIIALYNDLNKLF